MPVVAVDTFSKHKPLLDDAPEHAFSITKSDTDELPVVTRFIYVGGAGDISVVTKGGETVVFKAVPVGTTLRIRAKQITSANTTATLLIGLY